MTPTQKFRASLATHVKASIGGILVVTRDEATALKDIRAAMPDEGRVIRWTCASGFRELHADGAETIVDSKKADAFDAIQHTRDALFVDAEHPIAVVLVQPLAFAEASPVLRRLIVETIERARRWGHVLVLLDDTDTIPRGVGDALTVIHHPLPDREATRDEIAETLTGAGLLPPDDATLEALKGLSLSKQLDAVGVAAVEAKQTGATSASAASMRRFKEAEIGRSHFLSIEEPAHGFMSLLGHEALKTWLRRRQAGFSDAARLAGLPAPRGMLLCGPPGTGKSRFAGAVAHEWGTPFLTFDVASAFGSLLGETEKNVRRVIEIAERVAPCVLLIDEVERGFGAGERDGGTAERVLGQLLTWSANKTALVFVIYTSNYPDRLPPALIRKGRVDGIFFLDLPSTEEREAVFRHYLAQGTIPHTVSDAEIRTLASDAKSWTPAEVEAAVGEARYIAFADGGRGVRFSDVAIELTRAVPVAVSMGAEVERMRAWAASYATPTTDPVVETATNKRKVRG